MTVTNEARGKKGLPGIAIAGEASAAGVLGNHVGEIKELKHIAAGEYEFVLSEEAAHGYVCIASGSGAAINSTVLASTKTTVKIKIVNGEGAGVDSAFNFMIEAV